MQGLVSRLYAPKRVIFYTNLLPVLANSQFITVGTKWRELVNSSPLPVQKADLDHHSEFFSV